MRMIICIALSASAFMLRAGDFKVFYTPFEAKTSDIIDANNIEKISMVTIFVAGTFEADEILKLIKPSQSKTNKKALRLKLVVLDDVYLFDSYGVGIKNKKDSVCIDRVEFDKKISWNGICIRLNDESKIK